MNRTRPESDGEEVPDGDEERSEKDFEAALVAIRELQHARLVMCKPGEAAWLHYGPTARASSKSFAFPGKTREETGPTSRDIYSEDPTSKSFSLQGKTREEAGPTFKDACLEDSTSKPSLPSQITKMSSDSTSTSSKHSLTGHISFPSEILRPTDEQGGWKG